MREATPETPDYQKNLYNYNFKDKWDKSLAQAGMSSSLEPPDPDNIHSYGRNRKRSNHSTAASSESSAWGIFLIVSSQFHYIFYQEVDMTMLIDQDSQVEMKTLGSTNIAKEEVLLVKMTMMKDLSIIRHGLLNFNKILHKRSKSYNLVFVVFGSEDT